MLQAFEKEYFKNNVSLRSQQEIENPKAFFMFMQEPQEEKMVIKNGVANISIKGDLTNDRWRGSSYIDIRGQVEEAERNPDVKTIAFNVNSAGGHVDGVMETVTAIKNTSKPTVAKVGNLAASAAYWLACSCDKIEATTELAKVGSIGVMSQIFNDKALMEKIGVEKIVLTSTDAPNKHIDVTSEDGQKEIVSMLDKTHAVFAQAVASGRNTTVENVNENYGKGGILFAKDALKVGMIDSINEQHTEESMEKTYTQAEFESAVKEGVNAKMTEVSKHLDFIGKAKPETIKANLKEGKSFLDCVAGYYEEQYAKNELENKDDAPEGAVSKDKVEELSQEDQQAKKEEAEAKACADVLTEMGMEV